MKTIATLTITIALALLQACCIGLNGLTIVSIPLTIYLGILITDNITEK